MLLEHLISPYMTPWAYSSPWLFEANKHDFLLKKQKLQLQVHVRGWTLLQATRVSFMKKNFFVQESNFMNIVL